MQRHLRLEAVRGLDHDAEGGTAAPAQREEQVRVLALVRDEVPPVRGHHFDLELRCVRGSVRTERTRAAYHAVCGQSVNWGQDAMASALHDAVSY